MSTTSTSRESDVAVVGGGLVGSAIAWGLARAGQRVAVLDEGDVAMRASRGNFALIWVQGKGLGMSAYARWSLGSADLWPEFADELTRETGLNVRYDSPGGFHLTLSQREWRYRDALLKRVAAQPAMPPLPFDMMDRSRLARMLPDIGPEVAGGSWRCGSGGGTGASRWRRDGAAAAVGRGWWRRAGESGA